MRFFASTAKNIEPLLIEELKSFGAPQCKGTHLGVYFDGPLDVAYRACLWSRLANHIFLEIKAFRARNSENLYGAIRSVNWQEHLSVNQTFRIDVSGKHPTLTHPHFIAQVAKDAIVDQFRKETGQRPSIQPDQPDLVLHLHIRDESFTLNIDLSGESLHKRGIRTETGEAPLKETLASAILMRAGWPELLKKEQAMLFDPCCGAGTLLIEGAMMAYDIAPGSLRSYFGFLGWKQHDRRLWSELKQEAMMRQEKAMSHLHLPILGFDIDARALALTEQNFKKLQLDSRLQLEKRNVSQLSHPLFQTHQGLLVSNPPYGIRLMQGQTEAITQLYASLGEQVRLHLEGWKMALFTSDTGPLKALRMRPKKQYQLLNGLIDCTLVNFDVSPSAYWSSPDSTDALAPPAP